MTDDLIKYGRFAFYPDEEGSCHGRLEIHAHGKLVSIAACEEMHRRYTTSFNAVRNELKLANGDFVKLKRAQAIRDKRIDEVKELKKQLKQKHREDADIAFEISSLRAELSCVTLKLRALLDLSVSLVMQSQPVDECDETDYDKIVSDIWDMHNAITVKEEAK
jgi:hypothetical protein